MKTMKRVNGTSKCAGGKISGRAARAKRKAARGKIVRGRGANAGLRADRNVPPQHAKTGRAGDPGVLATRNRRIASLKASDAGMEGKSLAALRLWRRENKKRITLFLDADVLAWFKEKPKYQKEINRALREVMEEEAKGREG